MLYDYIINFLLPNLNDFVFTISMFWLIAGAVSTMLACFPDENKLLKRIFIVIATIVHTVCFVVLLVLFLIPDRDYFVFHYGDPRYTEITEEQKAQMQKEYDAYYERSQKLLIDCLNAGQKQPHTTVFNDTNEVVKTCYDVAKYKF